MTLLQTLVSVPRHSVAGMLPRAMPPMSRRNYQWELNSALLFSFALACVEGGVIGVIAQKAFGAGDFVIATLAAAPAFANITSAFWTRAIRGRDRVRAVNALQLGLIACVIAIAIAPMNALGVVILTVFVLLARSFQAGIITARSDIWRGNYKRINRARATGTLAIVASLIISASSLLIAWAMDAAGPQAVTSYRVMFIAAALVGAVGLWSFSHVRWRGRRFVMNSEVETAELHNNSALKGMVQVLRDDHLYRGYMIAMFVLGMANVAALAPFIIALEDSFNLDYRLSITLTQVAPLLMIVLTIPLWARFMDRVHVVRFRVWHAWFFVAAQALTGVGLLTHNFPIVLAARIILGVAFGGGVLAWHLGHNDFASKQMATIYMGIHVTLTGVRGVFAPFVGALIYSGLLIAPSPDSAPLIAIPGLAGWTFIVLAAVAGAGGLLFLRLDRRMRATTTAGAE